MIQRLRVIITVCGLVTGSGTMIAPPVHAQTPTQNAPFSKQLFQADLSGLPGQEVMAFFVEFAPGQGLPWHVHPGGHELVYSLEGTFVFEEQNGAKSVLKQGEVKYIGPDIGHAVRNEGTAAAKILVVRMKDKAKPIVTPLQH
jgi:quercetin dioxygenase-like cupin family protein